MKKKSEKDSCKTFIVCFETNNSSQGQVTAFKMRKVEGK